MPYIEKTGVKAIKTQLYQWYHVMTDPRIDGFNGFACKKKIWEIRDECNRILEQDDCPVYYEEDLYLDKLREERAVEKLQGTYKGIPYVP
ncbi:hypothetical protein OAA05_01000 [bacterium]|nr:hypothetical protein [bacterium]